MIAYLALAALALAVVVLVAWPLGRPAAEVVNKDACANPGAFDWFVDYARQRATGAKG